MNHVWILQYVNSGCDAVFLFNSSGAAMDSHEDFIGDSVRWEEVGGVWYVNGRSDVIVFRAPVS